MTPIHGIGFDKSWYHYIHPSIFAARCKGKHIWSRTWRGCHGITRMVNCLASNSRHSYLLRNSIRYVVFFGSFVMFSNFYRSDLHRKIYVIADSRSITKHLQKSDWKSSFALYSFSTIYIESYFAWSWLSCIECTTNKLLIFKCTISHSNQPRIWVKTRIPIQMDKIQYPILGNISPQIQKLACKL